MSRGRATLHLLALGALLARCADPVQVEDATLPPPPAQHYEMPYKTQGDYLAVYDGSRYRSLFLKGVNIGLGMPGAMAGELGATREQYLRWLQMMSDSGMNVLRSYTLHYPRFYEALVEHNAKNPDKPIYLLQGVWLDEDMPNGDLVTDQTDHFDAAGEEVLDCVHGNRVVNERLGRAWGTYTTDASPWVIGWIIGREISHEEAQTVIDHHAGMSRYDGTSVSLPSGSPFDVWAAARIDRVVTYEREVYHRSRPISFSSWPTLDPLFHPTENDTQTNEDVVQFDLAGLDLSRAPAGFFASFHAYPYYPDFINEDPDYATYRDESGPNNYLGYLTALRAHYGPDIPLIVGEFGVPSSWGSAHFSLSCDEATGACMGHGDHDEAEQGRMDARQLETLYAAGTGGGALFAWIDEWWKRTWICDEVDFPRERRPLWWNVTAAEQNFGLIAFDPGPPDYREFPAVTVTRGGVSALHADADVAYFHLRLDLDEPVTDQDAWVIGWDTYRDDLGETRLPDGTETGARNEFALEIAGSRSANLLVTRAYNTRGIWHGTSDTDQYLRSMATDGAPWDLVTWQNNQEHNRADTGAFVPATYFDAGRLRIRTADQPADSRDAIVISPDALEIRIPWTYLNVTDPSSLKVLADDRGTSGRETEVTEGFRITVVRNGVLIAQTARIRWAPWERSTLPPYSERVKPAFAEYAKGLAATPYWIDAP